MPKRNSFIHTIESTTPRRSPRFLLHRTTTEPPHQPKTPRKAQDSKSFNSKSTHKLVPSSPTTIQIVPSPLSHKVSNNKSSYKKLNDSNTALTGLRRSSRLNNEAGGPPCLRRSSRLSRRKIVFHELRDFKSFNSKSTQKLVCSSNPSSPTTIQIGPLPLSHKVSNNKSSKKLNDFDSKTRNCNTALTGLRRSSRLNNGAGGSPCLRRSSRLSRQKIVFHDLRDSPRRGMKKSSKPDNPLGNSENVTPGSRKSAGLNNCVQSPRRSQRLLNMKNVSSEACQKASGAGSVETIDSDSDFSVEEEETGQVVARKAKVKDKSMENSSGKCEHMTGDVSITRKEFKIEGREVPVRYDDKSEDLVKRKRKREKIENNEETKKGWTKEQEVALQKAYFAAKPTPHFWKKVSKLVPGKSAQDCFERIHQDLLTPPQHKPRSRAKRMKSSPLEQFSLSASKLLKPIVNKARRSSCFKSKSYLTQKSLRKLLHRYGKVDRDHEGDLFSVLEPNVDFSTIAFLPSDALLTPKQLDEKQGWLQSYSEKSSSSHGKSLSRFRSLCDTDIVSPPVLKQVKNRVLHEKYINQLRCREARRRAASARVEMSKTGKAVREESNIQKRGMVESAKIALVSEARDAIKKFQHSQANLMGSCSSDEDIDDGIKAQSFDDEDESLVNFT